MSSLSCEPCPGKELVISLFEVPFSPEVGRTSGEQQPACGSAAVAWH